MGFGSRLGAAGCLRFWYLLS